MQKRAKNFAVGFITVLAEFDAAKIRFLMVMGYRLWVIEAGLWFIGYGRWQ